VAENAVVPKSQPIMYLEQVSSLFSSASRPAQGA
jgi:hypothetical protein